MGQGPSHNVGHNNVDQSALVIRLDFGANLSALPLVERSVMQSHSKDSIIAAEHRLILSREAASCFGSPL